MAGKQRGFMMALQEVCWTARYPLAVAIILMWGIIIGSRLS